MFYSVPTNFQDDLIHRLNKANVRYLYGKLAADFVGGGRPSFMLPSVNRRRIEEHIHQARKNGLGFNYLLNATCLGNREYTISGQRQIRRLLDWLVSIKVDSVTVAIPYLVQLIKKNYPQLKVCASSLAHIDSLLKAKYWQDLGADLLVLHLCLNRDFENLIKIRAHIKCKLELIANNACLYKCPLANYHSAVNSHASQDNRRAKSYYISYCVINCRMMRMQDPINFIRSDWIRPEDVCYYEKIGIDYLKITDRMKSQGFILNTVDAYAKRSYKGNLADLFYFSADNSASKGIKKYLHYLRYLFKPWRINAFLVHKIFNIPALKVYIDNGALDGFLDFFIKGNCRQELCEECGYCRKVAEKSVRLEADARNKVLSIYKEALDEIISDRPFRYF